MYKLCMIVSLVLLGSTALMAQEVQAENLRKETAEKVKESSNSPSPIDIHVFMCARCGTENVIQWNVMDSGDSADLIPHCTFCGKKYWPKFKPSGFLMRNFCDVTTDKLKSDTRL